MSGSRTFFFQRGSKLYNFFFFFFFFFFLVDKGIEDLNTPINGLSSTCQRNVIEMALMAKIECWLGSLVIFQGI